MGEQNKIGLVKFRRGKFSLKLGEAQDPLPIETPNTPHTRSHQHPIQNSNNLVKSTP